MPEGFSKGTIRVTIGYYRGATWVAFCIRVLDEFREGFWV